ncbi:hypothetical protein [Cucumibacter marinus]|uniref:hypothetical protein n=1 Tax=Cucumibacter marinus TaxID=1121252 RepID=UPI0012DF4E92|nr:hypothetical protein [Cucumibacter marinus]
MNINISITNDDDCGGDATGFRINPGDTANITITNNTGQSNSFDVLGLGIDGNQTNISLAPGESFSFNFTAGGSHFDGFVDCSDLDSGGGGSADPGSGTDYVTGTIAHDATRNFPENYFVRNPLRDDPLFANQPVADMVFRVFLAFKAVEQAQAELDALEKGIADGSIPEDDWARGERQRLEAEIDKNRQFINDTENQGHLDFGGDQLLYLLLIQDQLDGVGMSPDLLSNYAPAGSNIADGPSHSLPGTAFAYFDPTPTADQGDFGFRHIQPNGFESWLQGDITWESVDRPVAGHSSLRANIAAGFLAPVNERTRMGAAVRLEASSLTAPDLDTTSETVLGGGAIFSEFTSEGGLIWDVMLGYEAGTTGIVEASTDTGFGHRTFIASTGLAKAFDLPGDWRLVKSGRLTYSHTKRDAPSGSALDKSSPSTFDLGLLILESTVSHPVLLGDLATGPIGRFEGTIGLEWAILQSGLPAFAVPELTLTKQAALNLNWSGGLQSRFAGSVEFGSDGTRGLGLSASLSLPLGPKGNPETPVLTFTAGREPGDALSAIMSLTGQLR